MLVTMNTITNPRLASEIEDAVESGFLDSGNSWKYLVDEDRETKDWTVAIQGPQGPDVRRYKLEFKGTDQKTGAFVTEAVIRLLQAAEVD